MAIDDIHAMMKAPSRHILGKVEVTYSNPLKSEALDISDDVASAYNTKVSQLIDGKTDVSYKYFATFDSNLTGEYKLVDNTTQVGWYKNRLSAYSCSYPHAHPLQAQLWIQSH